jgi:hypothetical protein
MNRQLRQSIRLSDGTFLPRGSRFMVTTAFVDPSIYPEPEKFDALRFAKEREKPGMLNAWQHVTTSKEHMGFGYGMHACPGRCESFPRICSNRVRRLLTLEFSSLRKQRAEDRVGAFDAQVRFQACARVVEGDGART